MIGPFPWYYHSRHQLIDGSYEELEPRWNEERGNWEEWRMRIPPEWRFQNLHDAPDHLKEKLGLMSYEYTFGDPSCEYCKACRCYKTCKSNNMHGQANCASHQLWCSIHRDPKDPQTLLSEFQDHCVINATSERS